MLSLLPLDHHNHLMETRQLISLLSPEASIMHSESPQALPLSTSLPDAINVLKRNASLSFDAACPVGMSRKRIKLDPNDQYATPVDTEMKHADTAESVIESLEPSGHMSQHSNDKGKAKDMISNVDIRLSEALFDELKCGCCTELCYNVGLD